MEGWELAMMRLDYWRDERVMRLLDWCEELMTAGEGGEDEDVGEVAMPTPKRTGRPKKGTLAERRQIARLYEKLKSYSAVARHLESVRPEERWSKQTVRNIILAEREKLKK